MGDSQSEVLLKRQLRRLRKQYEAKCEELVSVQEAFTHESDPGLLRLASTLVPSEDDISTYCQEHGLGHESLEHLKNIRGDLAERVICAIQEEHIHWRSVFNMICGELLDEWSDET